MTKMFSNRAMISTFRITNIGIICKQFILFADDTNIFCAEKDLYSLSIMLNNELQKISTWLKANILSINLDKTKFMIFKTRSKQLPHNFELYFDNHLVNQTGHLRFLGVILDEKLSIETTYFIYNK